MFRSYDYVDTENKPRKASSCQTWQVARATTAAPGYFATATIDGEEFFDGGFGSNNPSHEAFTELSRIHPKMPMCLVSIGSGNSSSVSRYDSGRKFGRRLSYLRAARKIVTGSATTHKSLEALARYQSEKFSYFRFDVPGLDHIQLDEWKKKTRNDLPTSEKMHTNAFIKARTDVYLANPQTRQKIRYCAEAIVDSLKTRIDLSPKTSPITVGSLQHQVSRGLFLVPPRNNLFHGHEKTIQNIADCLHVQASEKDSRIQYCILSGMVGIGKTQVAVEYVYRYRWNYQCVFWVSASNKTEIVASYTTIASSLFKLSSSSNNKDELDTGSHVQAVSSWLSSTGRPSVFSDNRLSAECILIIIINRYNVVACL